MRKSKSELKITDIRRLMQSNTEHDEKEADVRNIKIYATLALIAVSIILTLMNVIKNYTAMAIATSVLTLCLIAIAYMFRHKMVAAGNILFMIVIIAIFTYFAICGKNEGFAILWIMLIPGLSTTILNLKKGVIISLYFQLLLVVMFYTPLRAYFTDFYTSTFIGRYPVLYLANMGVSFLVAFEKEFYSEMVRNMAITDMLTGILNRRGYEEQVAKIEDNWDKLKDLTVISIDVNGLKKVNDTIGHIAGDETIVGAADCISDAFPDAVAVARVGGDEYSVISTKSYAHVDKQLAKLDKNVEEWRGNLVERISISVGPVKKADYPDKDFMELYGLSDEKMYESKRKYYDEHGFKRGM